MTDANLNPTENCLTASLYRYASIPRHIIESWYELRNSNSALYSPYFHPDYTKIISTLRDDVKVAVLEDNDKAVAILPFQGGRFAQPLGAPMTDYHGLICHPDTNYSLKDILKPHNIFAYNFDALISQKPVRNADKARTAVIFFPEGSEAWLSSQGSAFTKHQREVRRRLRKATEEVGEPRFVALSQNLDEFKTLIEWKIDQYNSNRLYNVFSVDWTIALLKTLLKESGDLKLHMHALYFGDTLAAVDTGLSDGKTYHRWIVAYRPELHKYAPGTQILNKIIRDTDALGYDCIDHGVGTDDFKKYYSTEDIYAYSGFENINPIAGLATNSYHCLEVLGTKCLNDVPGKLRRRYQQIAGCESGFINKQIALATSIQQKIAS